jgi:hypothetical protein
MGIGGQTHARVQFADGKHGYMAAVSPAKQEAVVSCPPSSEYSDRTRDSVRRGDLEDVVDVNSARGG